MLKICFLMIKNIPTQYKYNTNLINQKIINMTPLKKCN